MGVRYIVPEWNRHCNRPDSDCRRSDPRVCEWTAFGDNLFRTSVVDESERRGGHAQPACLSDGAGSGCAAGNASFSTE